MALELRLSGPVAGWGLSEHGVSCPSVGPWTGAHSRCVRLASLLPDAPVSWDDPRTPRTDSTRHCSRMSWPERAQTSVAKHPFLRLTPTSSGPLKQTPTSSSRSSAPLVVPREYSSPRRREPTRWCVPVSAVSVAFPLPLVLCGPCLRKKRTRPPRCSLAAGGVAWSYVYLVPCWSSEDEAALHEECGSERGGGA